jgi:hypothetical protein
MGHEEWDMGAGEWRIIIPPHLKWYSSYLKRRV